MTILTEITAIGTDGHGHFIEDESGNRIKISRSQYFKARFDIEAILDEINNEMLNEQALYQASISSGLVMA